MTPQAGTLSMIGVGASRQRRRSFRSLGHATALLALLVSLTAARDAAAQAIGEQTEGTPSTAAALPPVAPPPVAATTVVEEPAAAAAPDTKEKVTAPPAVTEPSAAPAAAKPLAKPVDDEPLLTNDELNVAGYMPGYRRYEGSLSPHVPRVGSLPGGFTPAFGAPNRADDWTFRFSGSMNISLQNSTNKRRRVAEGQASTVFHTPPQTIEEWSSFTSTNSVPGNWVSLNFAYGNSKVTARTSIDTYNPTQPTTYYQIGSQYFVNNAYLQLTPGSIAGVRFNVDAGFMTASYGALSRYGGGMYVNPIAGSLRGVGETTRAEYDLTDKLQVNVEHGFMTPRNGWVANNIVASPINGYIRNTSPAAWIHHAHTGLLLKGDTQYQLQLHYLHNWAQDERTQWITDNPVTRQLNETDIPDGAIRVYAADARAINDIYGYLSAGAAYIKANGAYPLKGLVTYGGDGENLSDRWLGIPAYGTGSVLVTAVNYGVSLGKIVAQPQTFAGDGPDIVLNAGFHWATTRSDYKPWNGRDRYKGGLDALYTLFRYMGVGCRFDTVVPNSKDMDETFYVLAPRLQFKTDWTSREALNIMYARWFYGDNTRNEGTGERTPERLDNQLLALNINLWW